MITAIVTFNLLNPMPAEKAKVAFLQAAPKVQDAKRLVRKYYILADYDV